MNDSAKSLSIQIRRYSMAGQEHRFINSVQKRDNYYCQYCGKDILESLDNWKDGRIDHFIPADFGGSEDDSNLVTACSHCNEIKSDNIFKSMAEAREYIAKERKERERTFMELKAILRGEILRIKPDFTGSNE